MYWGYRKTFFCAGKISLVMLGSAVWIPQLWPKGCGGEWEELNWHQPWAGSCSVGLGWVSLPWASLLGLACMDPACQVCAQNHFRFSPECQLQCAAGCQCVPEPLLLLGVLLRSPGSSSPGQGEGNALFRVCSSSLGLALPSACLEVGLIYLIPLFSSQQSL